MGPLRPGGGRDLPLLSVYVWRGVVAAAAQRGGGSGAAWWWYW
jgi:hypothetical protein